MGGVEGLPDPTDPEVLSCIAKDEDNASVHALEGMVSNIKRAWKASKQKVTIIATGPLTNIALFVSTYPELTDLAIEEIVFMGGGVGVGNRGAVAGDFDLSMEGLYMLSMKQNTTFFVIVCDPPHTLLECILTVVRSSCSPDYIERTSEGCHGPSQCYSHGHCDERNPNPNTLTIYHLVGS